MGRWTAVDPTPNGNVYQYVGNHPIQSVDPNGQEEKPSIFTVGKRFLDAALKVAGPTVQAAASPLVAALEKALPQAPQKTAPTEPQASYSSATPNRSQTAQSAIVELVQKREQETQSTTTGSNVSTLPKLGLSAETYDVLLTSAQLAGGLSGIVENLPVVGVQRKDGQGIIPPPNVPTNATGEERGAIKREYEEARAGTAGAAVVGDLLIGEVGGGPKASEASVGRVSSGGVRAAIEAHLGEPLTDYEFYLHGATAEAAEGFSLEQDFVDRLVENMSSFLLGGRAWTVDRVIHEDREVIVREAPRGVKPSREHEIKERTRDTTINASRVIG